MLRNSINMELENSGNNQISIKNGAPNNRPSDTSYALIRRIHDDVRAGYIDELFTVRDIEEWMSEHNIRKEDGTKYKEGYVATLLSNSLIKDKKTKNRNSRWLHRRKNNNGIYVYWFTY